MINYAANIKTILLDHLLQSNKQGSFIISHEMPFESGNRRADIALIKANSMTAYEIKGPQDNLSKLSVQMDDYQKTFNYTYLVVAPIHLKAALLKVSKKIGIIVISVEDRELKVVRNAVKVTRLSKLSLAHHLARKDILSFDYFKSRPYLATEGLDKLRLMLAEKVTLQSILTKAIEINASKYKRPFASFTRERGLSTVLDDLKNLVQR